jgi:hypothetical protein
VSISSCYFVFSYSYYLLSDAVVTFKIDNSIVLSQNPIDGSLNIMTAGKVGKSTYDGNPRVLQRKYPVQYHRDISSPGTESLNEGKFMPFLRAEQYIYLSRKIPRFLSAFHCGQSLGVHVVYYIGLGSTALDHICGVLDYRTPEHWQIFRFSPSLSRFDAAIEGSWHDSGW